MPAAANAQHGFSAAPRAAEQQEPPPPPPQQPADPGGNGPVAQAANSTGTPLAGRTPRRGSESSRTTTDRRGTPATGVSPATAGGGERGGTLPLAKAQGGKLPFTGLDLMLIAFLGVALLGAGFAVRAASRVRSRRSPA